MKRFVGVVCAVVLGAVAVGCGGTSEAEKNRIADSFETSVGVDLPDSEVKCMVDALDDKLSNDDKGKADPKQLSAEGFETVKTTLDSCFSEESVRSAMTKQLGSQQLPANVDGTCIASAVASKLKMGKIFEIGVKGLDPATQSEIVGAAQSCIKK